MAAPAPTVEPASVPEPTRRPRPGAWRAAAVIVRNELSRMLRDRTALFFVVVLPIVIIVVIGSVFGNDTSFDVGVVDHDGSRASRQVVGALDGTGSLSVRTVGSEATLRRDIRTGTIDAGVVIPSGYGEALATGGHARVTLVADPTSTSATSVQAAVRAAVGGVSVDLAAGRAVADASAGTVDASTASERAGAVAASVRPVGVGAEQVDEGRSALGSFDYTAPANLVLFTFVNTIAVGSLLALERRQGITRRMLATPHGPGTILAGIGGSKFAFALLQSALIVVVGGLVFGVDWGDPVGAVAVVVVWAVVSTAVGLLVGATVRDPDQAQSIATPVAIALGMLGGCMWPLEIVPPAVRTAGHLTPQAWAMDAWIELIFDGGGLGDIAVELAVLAGFAVVLGLLARRQLRVALTG